MCMVLYKNNNCTLDCYVFMNTTGGHKKTYQTCKFALGVGSQTLSSNILCLLTPGFHASCPLLNTLPPSSSDLFPDPCKKIQMGSTRILEPFTFALSVLPKLPRSLTGTEKADHYSPHQGRRIISSTQNTSTARERLRERRAQWDE